MRTRTWHTPFPKDLARNLAELSLRVEVLLAYLCNSARDRPHKLPSRNQTAKTKTWKFMCKFHIKITFFFRNWAKCRQFGRNFTERCRSNQCQMSDPLERSFPLDVASW